MEKKSTKEKIIEEEWELDYHTKGEDVLHQLCCQPFFLSINFELLTLHIYSNP